MDRMTPDLLAAMRADIAAAKHVTAEIETEESKP